MKTKIEDRIKAVKDAVAKDNTEEIKAATEALQKEMMDMGSAMYQQAGAAGAGAAGAAPGADAGTAGSSGSSGKGDDTIDAEFTDAK
jgi:hypothetical protein